MLNIFKVKLSDIPIRSQQNLNLKVARAIQVKFREEFESSRTKGME